MLNTTIELILTSIINLDQSKLSQSKFITYPGESISFQCSVQEPVLWVVTDIFNHNAKMMVTNGSIHLNNITRDDQSYYDCGVYYNMTSNIEFFIYATALILVRGRQTR